MRTPWSVPDCALLAAEHTRLKRLYAAAVDHLFAVGYKVTDAEYQELKNLIEEARVQAEIAGHRLAEHQVGLHSKAG